MISSMAANYAHRVDEYVAGRPGYPVELLSDLPSANTIVELGAGTGKFTRLLALTGKPVIAIEPIEQMAARIQIDCPSSVEVRIGTAEAIPVADDVADIVCCAASFHWFDYAQATREILRVLKESGALALVWNIRNERIPWVAAFCKLLDSYAGSSPRRRSGEWRAIFSDVRFEYLGKKRYAWSHSMPPRLLVDRALSTSFIAALPSRDQKNVCDKVLEIIENDPSLAGKQEVQLPYVTELQVFRKRPSGP
jgi:SAM-dependent methyltransferase